MEVKLVFLVGIILAVVNVGSGLKCYDCTGGTTPNAADMEKHVCTPKVMECQANEVCTKFEMKLPVEGQEFKFAVPSCGNRAACKLFDTDLFRCYHCNSDLCNSSSYAVPSIAVIMLLLLLRFM